VPWDRGAGGAYDGSFAPGVLDDAFAHPIQERQAGVPAHCARGPADGRLQVILLTCDSGLTMRFERRAGVGWAGLAPACRSACCAVQEWPGRRPDAIALVREARRRGVSRDRARSIFSPRTISTWVRELSGGWAITEYGATGASHSQVMAAVRWQLLFQAHGFLQSESNRARRPTHRLLAAFELDLAMNGGSWRGNWRAERLNGRAKVQSQTPNATSQDAEQSLELIQLLFAGPCRARRLPCAEAGAG